MAIRELTEHPLGLTWVIDPVDEPDAMAQAEKLGEVVAVLQLFVAHERDGEAIARRLGVPFHSLPTVIPDSPFSVLSLDKLVWKERALWWPEPKGLIVPESIGTNMFYAVGPGPAGVHVVRRALPPGELRSFLPEHLLVGHGSPIHGGDAAAALLDALDRSRRDLFTFARKVPGLMRSMRGRS